MKTSSFSFNLPPELIAAHPAEGRSSSRLMVCSRNTRKRIHTHFRELPDHIPDDMMIILNNTLVRKARLFGTAEETGGRVEFLLVSPSEDHLTWKCISSKKKKQKQGKRFNFPGNVAGEISGKTEECLIIQFDRPVDDQYLQIHGQIPLPPYLKREPEPSDEKNYQTVYGNIPGSVAAPTAGLHFTPRILDELAKKSIPVHPVTLHVGIGTFLPVRTGTVEEHRMHSEWYEVPEHTAEMINSHKKAGGRILTVGTTSTRTLETACRNGKVIPGEGVSSLFIYPGYSFKMADALITNFHTPESTLLMLVCAFGGTSFMLDSYREAVKLRYRFYSYGDSMLII
ncbi:MAG: tRNA preQ1(34) S-adenosylmethionine ribosyltransferase-isomerase QueA [Spirochaetia bacterium]